MAEDWSSANFFRNHPRQKKVVCMKTEMQILRFYLVGQNTCAMFIGRFHNLLMVLLLGKLMTRTPLSLTVCVCENKMVMFAVLQVGLIVTLYGPNGCFPSTCSALRCYLTELRVLEWVKVEFLKLQKPYSNQIQKNTSTFIML